MLLLVGTFEPFQEEEANRAGADSFLKKPFDSQELLQRAHDLTAAAEQAPEPAFITTPADEMDLWQSPGAPEDAEAGELYAAESLAGDEPAGPLGQGVPDDMVLEASPWTEAQEGGTPEGWAHHEEPAEAPPAPEPTAAADADAASYATTLAPAAAATVSAAAAAAPAPAAAPAINGGGLSDADVDRIAHRVVELLGDQLVREVAWEVVPDMAELVIKDRLRELERQLEGTVGRALPLAVRRGASERTPARRASARTALQIRSPWWRWTSSSTPRATSRSGSASGRERGFFRAEAPSDRPSFCIMIPPPNVTGSCTWATPCSRRCRTC